MGLYSGFGSGAGPDSGPGPDPGPDLSQIDDPVAAWTLISSH